MAHSSQGAVAPAAASVASPGGAPARPDEDVFVRFGERLASLLAPHVSLPAVQAAVRQVLDELRARPPGPGLPSPRASADSRNLEIVFVHDCRNHGCNSPACVLCKHNPNKRCTGNFAGKYWVGDRLLAKCEGCIQVEIIDSITGERTADNMGDAMIEVCILDGNKYNTRCREAGEQCLGILDECEVLLNQKGMPLLVAGGPGALDESPRVALKFAGRTASVTLRDMKVTESSESVLAGTKRPPFRLVVRALSATGERLPIRPAVSEEFVVVTKRTKNLKKQEIPSLDDPISKLNHIGKETVKKLNELKASADEAQVDLHIPRDLWRVTKVREFQMLARMSEADGHLQQRLKQLLKLSKEKWDAACEHAKTAVQADNRMRAWYRKDMTLGLLYACSLGDVRPDCPVALVQNRRSENGDFMEVIPCEHQLPAQRKQVEEVCEAAVQCWWDESHPGWMIFTLGNQHYDTLDQIISSEDVAPSGMLTPSQQDAAARLGEMLSTVSPDSNGAGPGPEYALNMPMSSADTRMAAGRPPPEGMPGWVVSSGCSPSGRGGAGCSSAPLDVPHNGLRANGAPSHLQHSHLPHLLSSMLSAAQQHMSMDRTGQGGADGKGPTGALGRGSGSGSFSGPGMNPFEVMTAKPFPGNSAALSDLVAHNMLSEGAMRQLMAAGPGGGPPNGGAASGPGGDGTGVAPHAWLGPTLLPGGENGSPLGGLMPLLSLNLMKMSGMGGGDGAVGPLLGWGLDEPAAAAAVASHLQAINGPQPPASQHYCTAPSEAAASAATAAPEGPPHKRPRGEE